MSDEQDKLKQVLKEINAVSPSFCVAKWKQVTIKLQNGHTHSCHHPKTHKIPLKEIKENPSALHNTRYKKEQRKKMINGIRPKECQYCWNIEDMPGNNYSDRVQKSAEYWSYDYIDSIKNSSYDENINPSYVEVSFSNVCNFKCGYCTAVESSQWMNEITKHGPYNVENAGMTDPDWLRENGLIPIDHKETNPYVEAFWRWWPELYKDLEVFRITGGEPFLDKNTFDVLDYLNDNPAPQLEIGVNTNGCAPKKQIDKFISKLKPLMDDGKVKSARLYVSIDGAGASGEYSRTGLDYKQWLANVNKFLTELPNINITVMFTGNIFSIFGFSEFLDDIYDLKCKYIRPDRIIPIAIDTAIVRHPRYFCAAILTEDYWCIADEILNKAYNYEQGKNNNKPCYGLFEFEIMKIKRFVDFIKSQGKHDGVNLTKSRKDFVNFFNEYDRRRNLNLLESVPEIEEFYNYCKENYNE